VFPPFFLPLSGQTQIAANPRCLSEMTPGAPGISGYRTEFTASYQINLEKANAAQRRWVNEQGVEKQAPGRQPRRATFWKSQHIRM
jgi:hypothetical protein